MKAIFTVLVQGIGQALTFLLFFMVLAMTAVHANNSVLAAGEYYWSAGMLVAAIWLIGIFALWGAIWIAMRPSASQRFRKYVLIPKMTGSDAGLMNIFPGASLSALICASMLTAVLAVTAMSTILESQGLVTYANNGPQEQPTRELLFRLYMWHAIDLIPFLDIWQAFDIKPPIRPENFLGQMIIFGFRTAIIGFAISVLVQWLKFNRKAPADNEGA